MDSSPTNSELYQSHPIVDHILNRDEYLANLPELGKQYKRLAMLLTGKKRNVAALVDYGFTIQELNKFYCENHILVVEFDLETETIDHRHPTLYNKVAFRKLYGHQNMLRADEFVEI